MADSQGPAWIYQGLVGVVRLGDPIENLRDLWGKSGHSFKHLKFVIEAVPKRCGGLDLEFSEYSQVQSSS